MRRKTASIIGRIVGLILVAALAFGVTWCATNWSTVKAETSKWWDKITGNEQQEVVQPTPDDPTPDTPTPETPISLDGFYILDVDGDKTVVQFQNGDYRPIPARVKESGEVVFNEGWNDEEFEPYMTREDNNYIYIFVVDQDNGLDYNIAYCVKATGKVYYDFTNGDFLPGQSEYVVEMIPFTDFTVCAHDWQEDLTYVPNPPLCGEMWKMKYTCAICGCSEFRWFDPLQHDYVDGVCSRCGDVDPNHIVCLHEEITRTWESTPYVVSEEYPCVSSQSCEIGSNCIHAHLDWTICTCVDCGEVVSKTSNPTPHTYYDAGYCVICGTIHTHDLVETNRQESTCTTEGWVQVCCRGCNMCWHETNPALDHNYVNGVCARCGDMALTWVFNDAVDTYALCRDPEEHYRATTFNVSFESDGCLFSSITFEYGADGYPNDCILFDDEIVYGSSFTGGGMSVWNDVYRTITFPAETLEMLQANSNVFDWLLANATPQS